MRSHENYYVLKGLEFRVRGRGAWVQRSGILGARVGDNTVALMMYRTYQDPHNPPRDPALTKHSGTHHKKSHETVNSSEDNTRKYALSRFRKMCLDTP